MRDGLAHLDEVEINLVLRLFFVWAGTLQAQSKNRPDWFILLILRSPLPFLIHPWRNLLLEYFQIIGLLSCSSLLGQTVANLNPLLFTSRDLRRSQPISHCLPHLLRAIGTPSVARQVCKSNLEIMAYRSCMYLRPGSLAPQRPAPLINIDYVFVKTFISAGGRTAHRR